MVPAMVSIHDDAYVDVAMPVLTVGHSIGVAVAVVLESPLLMIRWPVIQPWSPVSAVVAVCEAVVID